MDTHFIISLLSLSLAATPSQAREILNRQTAEDYSKRKEIQPEIAHRLDIPVDITPKETEALKFLYAYLSTPDLLDYSPEFYLENIRVALKAAEEMPWGESVPDREWRHFVLPPRVNNEDMDHSRGIFYEELKERVKGLSMLEAILEVNHWCHEKVSYQPSDARTSSPLATVCNALGRCGEESTFTVAALRSIGIPARQVYTPRWAHTDDNHAWVEAWADGQWYFLGACEPEPIANLAWFNAPAARGMLMSTNVIGRYDGPEEVLDVTPISTVINVTENYAPVTQSGVFVTDTTGKPIKDAVVRFSLYNYAEFYPLVEKHTDSRGFADFTSGKGDMVVWASDKDNYNFSKLTAGDTIRLVLDKGPGFTGAFDFDLVPPPPGGKLPEVSEEARRVNDQRKAYEDSIRLAYTSTFISPERAQELCKELSLESSAADIIVKARGNHRVILSFLQETPPSLRKKAVAMLGAMAEKDLHDVTPDVLEDHLYSTMGDESSPLFVQYVLNPRIENEMLHPYKVTIQKTLSSEQAERYVASPRALEEDLRINLTIDSLFNPRKLRQYSVSTLSNLSGDLLNRSIAFVAVCRSLGIPARIDPVSGATQWADSDCIWHDADFGMKKKDENSLQSGSELKIIEEEITGRQPKYYSHFTLSRLVDGLPQLMEFDEFESVESINNRRQSLAAGDYMLVTGQRLADGSVLAHAKIFNADGKTPVTPRLELRQDSTALQVIGSLDAELLYTPVYFNVSKPVTEQKHSILSTTGRGYYVLGLVAPGHEPSSHALNDIAVAAEELEKLGNKILILFSDEESAPRFRISDYGSLPTNVSFGIDDGSIFKALQEGLELQKLTLSDFPLFVVADTFNRIVFSGSGYSIHLGDKLANILKSLE